MDERPDNHMDKVLRANREKAHSHMELITADGFRNGSCRGLDAQRVFG